MEIKPKMRYVEGNFNTETGEMVCVQKRKYGLVELCFRTENMHVPFATIKLHSEDLAIDADAVFDDACKLGDEIVRRWNESLIKK